MRMSSALKIGGYSLCLLVPMLVPLGAGVGAYWLSPIVLFGILPFLGLLVGQDNAPPVVGLRRAPVLVFYLDSLPRLYGLVWASTLVWAMAFVSSSAVSLSGFAGVMTGVGLSSALAICTAHELLHHRSKVDRGLARVMTSLCCYGHMVVEHLHHHATLSSPEYGATAARGTSAYRFAGSDYVRALRTAWRVEQTRVRRTRLGWWHNKVLQDYALALASAATFVAFFGGAGLILFLGQAVISIFAFEVITYVHHYGLVRLDEEDAGSHHAWAHHCWITNCLSFNNTFHSDHHLRPWTPYYELHAMHNAPRLPASYFSMFMLALVPPLWFKVMNKRLNALDRARDAGWQDSAVRAMTCR
jgi:alkane 1-monooxygenase